MPKPLPGHDFRSARTVLESDDFALAPEGPDPLPEDLVDKATWSGLVTLPDTVAVFTSNDHGAQLRLMHELWGECIEHLHSELQDATFYGMLSASDEFQAATFNALVGYYRVAIGCLRSGLESITIATYCQVRGAKQEFAEWQQGNHEIRFGKACDTLMKATYVQPLDAALFMHCGTDLFGQGQGQRKKGWVRDLYSDLSNYSHSRPGFEAADMWGGSNGPIYEKSAFEWTYRLWLQTLGTCFVLVKLARPATALTDNVRAAFAQAAVREACPLDTAWRYLWGISRSITTAE